VRHTSRGQVLPLWIVAVLTTFMLSFLAINYGNAVRYQIRAQNAADAAAQALMAIQTQRYNETTMALYAANIEEYRIRNLLNGIMLSLSGSGGCYYGTGSGTTNQNGVTSGVGPSSPSTTAGAEPCDLVFDQLAPAYDSAVNRYTVDVQRINDAGTSMALSNWESDARALLAALKTNCNSDTTATPNAGGGDCLVDYTLNQIGPRADAKLNQVAASAYEIYVPNLGLFPPGPGQNVPNQNTALTPGFVDVTTCITVPAAIPSFFFLHQAPYKAIGRAGATAVGIESDWMMPAQLVDNVRSSTALFQPVENYTTETMTDSTAGNNWFDVDYGGTQWAITPVAFPSPINTTINRYESTVNNNEFVANVAWWSAIPYDPSQEDATPPTPTCP